MPTLPEGFSLLRVSSDWVRTDNGLSSSDKKTLHRAAGQYLVGVDTERGCRPLLYTLAPSEAAALARFFAKNPPVG